MMKVRELNYNDESESWVFLVAVRPYQHGALISLRDDARLTFKTSEGKKRRYTFKKGAVLTMLKNDEVIYNKQDIVDVENIME